jgi:hypothetical protein
MTASLSARRHANAGIDVALIPADARGIESPRVARILFPVSYVAAGVATLMAVAGALVLAS